MLLRLVKGLAPIACFVLLPAAAFAQGSAFGGGTIAGIVKDTSGAVLPGVTVEAASPALIEKIRTAVTDSSGQYKIVDLRPGAYAVTFTLTGFNTYRRDGLELEGTAVITVNADLKVGSIAETITVSGETPIVDLQSTTRERVMSKEVIDSLPTSRLYYSLGVLVPGVSASTRDVGGAGGSQFNTTLTAHGSTGGDQRIMINGLNLGAIHVGNISNVVPNTGAAQEVQIDTAGASAERQTGGVTVNFLPRDGGNTLRGSVVLTGATENMQASNFTQELIDLGATVSPNKFKETWDFNPGVGGPILRDKLWFYYTFRAQGSQVKTDMFYNQNEFLPSVWTYLANPGRPALSQHGIWKDNNVRLTWQIDSKNKFAFTYSDQTKCACPDQISSTQAPEAAREDRNPLQRTLQAEWWSPLTSKVLLEVVAQSRAIRQGFMDLRPTSDGGSLVVTPAQYALYPSLIGVTQTNGGGVLPNGLSFHGPNGTFNTSFRPAYAYRAAVSYVTGAHAFKVGLQDTFGYATTLTYLPTLDTQNRPVRYRFATANTPDQVTVFNTQSFTRNDQDHDLGLFAQDRWTRDRLTLNLGVRLDWYKSSYPEQTLLATTIGRPAAQFASGQNLNWRDWAPRMAAAYDLRGDGKTAVKLSINKYVVNQPLGGLGTSANPIGRLTASNNRTWNDQFFGVGDPRSGNFVVDCDLTNPAINGECRNAGSAAFLSVVPPALSDQDLRFSSDGGALWNTRGYNWEFSAGVQREVIPRVSIEVSYFRRWYGNFTATDQTQLAPTDFDSFDVVRPRDSRLPGGGGNVITGFVDPKTAALAALTAVNKTVFADDIGANQIDHWNGVDVNLSARLQNGLLLQGGTSTGRRYTNNCEVSVLLPETLGNNPQSFCEVTEPWLTQVKTIASYTLPQYARLPPVVGRILQDVQVAGTFQSIPGGSMSATYSMPNAEFIAACPAAPDPSCSTLGRGISNANNKTIALIPSGSVMDERQNQLDLRVGRLLRLGRTRTQLSFDIFNVTNSNTILGRNNTLAKSATAGSYAASQQVQTPGAAQPFHTLWVPTSVLQARFYKLSVNFDF